MKAAILEGLYILLKRIPVSYALDYTGTESDKKTGKDIFVREFLRQYHMYSENEVNYIYDLVMEHGESLPSVVFRLLKEVAEEYLYMDGENLCCHQDKMLDFRKISMGIGQHLFISAFEAARKKRSGMADLRLYDAPIIKTDDLRLKHILNNGIAENHFHLNGSAPTAMLSWICLMNHPSKRNKEFLVFDERRNFFPSLEEDRGKTLQEQVITAAALRLMLNYVMNGRQADAAKVQKWLDLYRAGVESVKELQLMIDGERIFLQKDALDYIRFSVHRRPLFYPLAGEREFLINIFLNAWDPDIYGQKWIGGMYAYLLIYCRFYSEMIQSNQTVGFYNFMRYQDRKEIFLDSYPRYSCHVKKMALEMALEQECLVSLEVRITPKPTRKALVAQQKLFSDKIFGCDESRCAGCEHYDEILGQCSRQQCIRVYERMFFVYHFVKIPDSAQGKPGTGIGADDIKYRHYELRRRNIWPIIWKFNKLRKEEKIFDNVYGLDACNQEIGCRPEVFAPYFRFVREQDSYMENDLFGERKLPRLKITYHVGEDFLDVLDGLRAVEEAVTFLKLGSGDRLGHALALGVDVRNWYSMKKMRVYLNRQDILDNTAFLYHMIMEYRLDFPILQQKLESDFYRDFRIIYPDMQGVLIDDYILSMQLRGDEPGIYMQWERILAGEELEEGWKRLDNRWTREALNHPDAVKLFYKYHYDRHAKYEGGRPVEQKITEEYINAVAQVQKILCNKVAGLGIGIECNPSSNILIGMTKEYIGHPILRFNHYNLSGMDEDGIPEMFVSINTDDMGVFDTNLENEYALMVCALQQEKDEKGQSRFPIEEIYRWIDHIRRMGLEQSFKLSERIKGEMQYGKN